jgi:phosphoribosylformylglycinamidine cyclo-ligase
MHMTHESGPSTYRGAGVLASGDFGLAGLLKWVRATEAFRRDPEIGRNVADVGYFAAVLDIGNGQGLAVTTDGVGSKVLVAEMMNRFDTIGIDCVAMNVNDVICVGARPLSFLDYIAIESAEPELLESIAKGLHEGARQSSVNIVGGEISQIPEIITGAREGSGVDLVGMCVALVPVAEVNVGQNVTPGDVVIGLRSSGVHSNGYTLARRVLFDRAGLAPTDHVEALGRSVGEELLEPTRIYVPEIVELLDRKLPLHALVHVTGDGFLNLTRVQAPGVGFELRDLPAPQPIFDLIQREGEVTDAEMYRVFNMGVGFCVVVPDDRAVVNEVLEVMGAHDVEAQIIGAVIEDAERRVHIPAKRLVGCGDDFERVAHR